MAECWTISRRLALASLLALVAFSLTINWNTLGNGLVYDDNDAIVNNPAAHGIRNFKQIFTTPSWWPPNEDYVRHYRPVTTFAYAVNHSLHGLRPAGYHLANGLLHGVVSWLVYLVLAESRMGSGVAFIAAMLFLTHPIHTEAVAWTNGRADILAGGFILLSLLAHIRSIRESGQRRGLWSVVGILGFALAALAKETGYMAPFVVVAWDSIVLDQLKVRRAWSRVKVGAWKEYGCYLLTLSAFVWLRAHFVGGATVATVTEMASPLGGAGFFARLLTGSYVIAKYLWLLLWPAKLSVDYSPDQITRVNSLADPRALIGLGVVIACCLMIVWLARRSRLTCFTLVMAAIVFAPASNVPFPVGTIMAERLMYLPVLAFCVPVASGIWRLNQRTGRSRVAFLVAGLLIAAYSVRTIVRNRDWHGELSLFQSALEVSPRSAMANKNFASALHNLGRNEEAIPLCLKAIEILPAFPDAHYVLGNCYFMTGRREEAIEQYRAAIDLVPRHAAAHTNLGATYHVLGRYSGALQEFDTAIEIDPGQTLAWFNRVHTLVALGYLDEAETALQEAARRFPDHPGIDEAREKVENARAAKVQTPTPFSLVTH